MKHRRLIWTAGTLVIGAAFAAIYIRRADDGADTAYRFAEVVRTDLVAAVTATGKLQPVSTVQVGTQVSGQVAGIYADFNSHVKKGQLIARIDPTLLQQAAAESQANLAKARAQSTQAESDDARSRELFARNLVSESDFTATHSKAEVARADQKAAEVALKRAQRNLAYTEIYSPIDGVVIERNVDVGQTVAANFSAPQLFLIANDLRQMQILAAVDQADIGQIHVGQTVRFDVQAYADRGFSGTVEQVRLQSTVQDNVVTYVVVVAVENGEQELLPGMTASLQFVTAEAKDVLAVPNGALRFIPPSTADAGAPAPRGERGSARPGAFGARQPKRPGEHARLWHLQGGKLEPLPVVVGISDGQRTQVSGQGLGEGMQIVVGSAPAAAGAFASPFQPSVSPHRSGGF